MAKNSSIDVTLRTNEGMKFSATTVQRVQDAIRHNSIYESSPNKLHEGTTYEKIMNLRPR